MTPEAIRRLTGLGPAIKEEWTSLLQGEPTLTPLGRPDTLVYLMDATLTQLFAGLEQHSAPEWLRHCPPLVGSVHAYCACGLNPLLKYYATGELALRAAAGPKLGPDIDAVLERFRALARHEINTLCSVCQHRSWEGCDMRSSRPPASVPH